MMKKKNAKNEKDHEENFDKSGYHGTNLHCIEYKRQVRSHL
jgi:hypothetical protein